MIDKWMANQKVWSVSRESHKSFKTIKYLKMW